MDEKKTNLKNILITIIVIIVIGCLVGGIYWYFSRSDNTTTQPTENKPTTTQTTKEKPGSTPISKSKLPAELQNKTLPNLPDSALKRQ